MKRVLIITYYWPPSGGGGVQRWLKMSRYLHEYGWEPVIYTPENPAFEVRDESLSAYVRDGMQVIRTPIREPIEVFRSLFRLTGKKAPEQKDLLAQRDSSLFRKATTWLRGNVFLPDPRRTWVAPSVRFLEPWICENGIDAIITTGPPHSMHLIGQRLKRAIPELRWMADFRDPWSEWDLWPLLYTGERAMKKIRQMERSVLSEADVVVSISRYHVERLKVLGARRCELVPNGYDHQDFEGIQKTRTDSFVIRHMGSVDDLRDPRPFIRAVEEAITQDGSLQQSLRIEFYGPVNNVFREDAASSPLADQIQFLPAVPHKDVIRLYVNSSVLLLVLAHTDIAQGNTPGKMYEYMASGTPVLGLGPKEGDAAEILRSTGTGAIVDRDNQAELIRMLLSFYQEWKKEGVLHTQGAPAYSRRELAGRIAAILSD